MDWAADVSLALVAVEVEVPSALVAAVKADMVVEAVIVAVEVLRPVALTMPAQVVAGTSKPVADILLLTALEVAVTLSV